MRDNGQTGAASADAALRRANALLAGEKRILELVATGAPLEASLAELVRFIERQEEGLRCAILVVAEDGTHLCRGSAPNLPESYQAALDGAPITPPYLDPCGQAAGEGVAVFVPDIATDERWAAAWREPALSCGLRACRSTPVRSSTGQVLASFAMYYDRPRDPQPDNPELIEIAIHLAGIALERRQAEAELKRAEETLRERDERFRDLLEALPAAVYTTDAAGRITFYNDAAVKLAGRRPALGSDEWCVTWRLFWPDGRPMAHDECPMAVALKENRPIRGQEAIAEGPDGTRVPFIPYPTPLRDASGALVGAVNMLVDITDRKKAEAALRDSEERLRALFDSTAAGIAVLTPSTTFLQVNSALCAITGYSAEELSKMDCARLMHPDDWAQTQKLIDGLLAGRMPSFVVETRYVRKNGAVIWVQSSVSLTRDAAGQPQHLIALCQDVNERKRAEALLECQRRALQMLVMGAPPDEVLGFLIDAMERQAGNGMLGSILLLNEAGTHFERGIGPSLPPAFNAAVAGIAVSSAIGVCCLAASRGEAVAVPDFSADPQWERFVEFVAPYDLRSGWSTPIFGSSGKILGTFATYYRAPRDPAPQDMQWVEIVTRTAAITIERAHAEAALRKHREVLTAAMAASDTGTFRWNPRNGEFLDFDDNLKRLFGFAPGERVGTTADAMARVHPEDRAALLLAVEACRRGADFSMEYRVMLPDGSIRWLNDRAKMEHDAQGEPTYLVGACTDITARKQAEEALRESEEHFRTLAESIPQLTWMARSDGWIFWFNRRWYDYTGKSPEEMAGWGWQSVHDPEVLPRVLERWRHSIATGEPFEMVFPIRGADGVFRSFLTRVVPVRGTDGRILRWFGTNTDITKQRDTQEALRRLTETLEERVAERTRQLTMEIAEREKLEAVLRQAQKLEAVGQLTGGVAHDFNNLLTAITGNLDLLESRAHSDKAVARYVGAAQRAAARGARLTQQLLAFARRQTLRPEIVDIGAAVTECEGLLRRGVGEAIEIVIDADPDLWLCRVDPAQFDNALLNLAINARDAMPNGGRLSISLRNTEIAAGAAPDLAPGFYVLVAVADTGHGIPVDQLDRVFEPFFTTKEVGKGSGLGLSQVHGFVKQSGGHVAIESVVGIGTTVSLYLPKASGVMPGHETSYRAGSEPPTGSETILMVEDDRDILEVTAATLEELGYRVQRAQSGPEALSLIERGEPVSLLFTDLVMPQGMSGGELARRVRQAHPEIKILLATGYAAEAATTTDDIDGFPILNKPYRRAELARKIRAVLSGQSEKADAMLR